MVSSRLTHLLVPVATALLAAPAGHAMCVATTQNLLRVGVLQCQPIRIGASHPGNRSHAVHKRGSSVTGVLITGQVLDSEVVWDSRWTTESDYVAQLPRVPTGQQHSFFLQGSADDICAGYVGTERIFITERPCCDVIPARGLCLVPAALAIVREEDSPERWEKWQPAAADGALQTDPTLSARAQVRAVVQGIIAANAAADVDRVMRFYADDAVLIPPNLPTIDGRDAIREDYERLFEEANLLIEPRIDGIRVSNDEAVVRGINYIRSARIDTGVSECVSSRYLMTLRRLDGGEWKIDQWMWSDEPVACE
jgi:uncharacterized protein (TIGR02246 family)